MSVTALQDIYSDGIGDHNGIQCAEISVDGAVPTDSEPADDSIAGSMSLAQHGLSVESGLLKGSIWFDSQLGFSRESEMTLLVFLMRGARFSGKLR
jgi:hypothetical protein